ncbi:MAG: repeat-containing protein [Acidobacteria bacterium]|nr:repeat-containing protein [Acidobacteriota bacterium]
MTGMRFASAVLLLIALTRTNVPVQAGGERLYELQGRVVQSNKKPWGEATPVVFLHGVLTPFHQKTFAESSGKFKFKNLRPGLYSVIVGIPMRGEMIRTIDIGPTFADSKGRVSLDLTFEPAAPEEAKTVSAAALSIPGRAQDEYRKAQDRLARHDLAGAIVHLKKAVEFAPQFTAALNNLGTIAYQSRNYEEAEGYFRRALEQDPDSYPPMVNLGGALLSGGKTQESLKYNLLAVRARPGDALARSQLGQSYMLLGQTDLAETELKKAKALDPGHFSFPQLVLAEIYARRQEYSSAALEVEEFLKLHPDSDRAPNLRRILEELRGKVKKCPAYFFAPAPSSSSVWRTDRHWNFSPIPRT